MNAAKQWLLGATLAGAAATSASAAWIVDTGSPTGTSGWGLHQTNAGSFQYLATSFVVGSDTSIEGVYGWLRSSTGSVMMQLHDGATPNASVLHSTTAHITDTNAGWQGVSGLNWSVAAGPYTLSFVPLQGYNGAMPKNPPSPLLVDWYNTAGGGGWEQDNTLNIAVRVNAVPEAGSWAMLSLGLAMVLGAARRRTGSS